MKEYIEGQRYEFTRKDFQAIINMSGSALTGIIIGVPDYALGRRFEKAPGDWVWWNAEGKKVSAHISRDGVIVSCAKEVDPERPEPL